MEGKRVRSSVRDDAAAPSSTNSAGFRRAYVDVSQANVSSSYEICKGIDETSQVMSDQKETDKCIDAKDNSRGLQTISEDGNTSKKEQQDTDDNQDSEAKVEEQQDTDDNQDSE
eukprot:gene9930-2113_t